MRLQASCAISALAKLYCRCFHGDLLESIFCPVDPTKFELMAGGYACVSLIGCVRANCLQPWENARLATG